MGRASREPKTPVLGLPLRYPCRLTRQPRHSIFAAAVLTDDRPMNEIEKCSRKRPAEELCRHALVPRVQQDEDTPNSLLAAAAAVEGSGRSNKLPLALMDNPVTLSCGHNFEQETLRRVADTGSGCCPECGAVLPKHLKVNTDVQRLIWQVRDLHRGGVLVQTANGVVESAAHLPHVSERSGQGAVTHPNSSLAAAAAAIADGVFGSSSKEAVPSDIATHAERPKFEVPLFLGRDTDDIRAILATRFASLLASVSTRTDFSTTELPLSLTKRVMKQDAFDARPRTVSANAVALMEFASEIFVGLVTSLAWQVATQPAKRNTLVLRDLGTTVDSTCMLDFLRNTVTSFGAQLEVIEANPKQLLRIQARHHEKQLAMSRMVSLNPHGSRKLVARRRQRGLHGRFLGSAESDAIETLVRTASDPGPETIDEGFHQAPNAPPEPQPVPRDQRRSVFPVANIMRVMCGSLPPGVKIAKDAKECMCEMAGEMTALVAMEANTLAKAAIGLDECVEAFTRLGLDGFVPALELWIKTTNRGATVEMDEGD